MAQRYPVPAVAPTYDTTPVKVKVARQPEFHPVLDSVFIVLAIIFTLWFSAVLLIQGLRLSWTHLLYLIPFWIVLTYLALPRLHQFFTLLYVPNYFIGRTRTADGLLGDPINLALDGSEEDIHAAMQGAGWVLADEITLRSAWGMVLSAVLHRSYPEAPVSDLYLFGRRQDFAYQQEVGGNPHQRHHVRFWRVPEGWLLPGGHSAQWLAAGTYDRSVGLSAFTFQITHKIDADTDRERDYIVDTVRYADPDIDVHVIKDFSTAYHHRNGGGDLIQTDGDLPVLKVAGARERFTSELVLPECREKTSHGFPPASLIIALVAIAVSTALSVVTLFGEQFTAELEEADVAIFTSLLHAFGIVTMVVMAALIVLTLARRRWAKVLLLSVTAADTAGSLLQASALSKLHFSTMASAAASVLILLALTSDTVRAWVAEPNTRILSRMGD